MNKSMKSSLFLIFMCWALIAVSGCVASGEDKQSSVSVEDIEVKPLSEEYSTPVSGETGTVLNISADIINSDTADSSALIIRFKLDEVCPDPYSNRELTKKNVELDYIKGRSMLHQSVQIAVPGPGTYDVEVSVFEEGKVPSTALGMVFFVGEKGEVGTF